MSMTDTTFRKAVAVALFATLAAAVKLQPSATDPCQCLNWEDTYAAGKVGCGQGLEFTQAVGYPWGSYPALPGDWVARMASKGGEPPPHLWMEYADNFNTELCKHFYYTFNDTKCTRASFDSHPTEWYGKSWCYVSSECERATPVNNSEVALKICAEDGTDALLSDMSPEELMAYGKKMDLSHPGVFVKMAYPFDRSFYWVDRANHTRTVSALTAGNTPVVVDKVDENGEKIIVWGKKVCTVGDYESFQCTD